MKNEYADIVIMGGGLQGCCIALELARAGIAVTLIEQDHQLMNRASLRNEGKIHLGLVYANDPSMETARFQLKGALSFGKLLQRWTGCSPADLGLSTPFNYLVANDSLLTLEEIEAYCDGLTQLYLDYLALDPGLDYLGTRPAALACRGNSDAFWAFHNRGHFIGGLGTAELAIDTARLAELVRAAVVRNDRIRTLVNLKVDSLVRNDGYLQVECSRGSRSRTLWANQVVNATWGHRLAIDSEFGLDIGAGWVHRLKYRVIARLPAPLRGAPSITVVLGRYGDVVIRRDATAYLSWYPVVMRGWSHDMSPPAAWDQDCREQLNPERAKALASEVSRAIDDWYPGMKHTQLLTVDAGVIFAHGHTDVDDPVSGLHRRSDTGSSSRDGYHSVNPAKLTTAPLMAISVVQQITGRPCEDLGPIAALVE